MGKTAGRAHIFEAESAILEKACEIIHETPLSLRDISPEGEKNLICLLDSDSHTEFSPPEKGECPKGEGVLIICRKDYRPSESFKAFSTSFAISREPFVNRPVIPKVRAEITFASRSSM